MNLPKANETAWRKALERKAARYAACTEEAQDIVQETLIAYWQRSGTLPWEHLEESDTYRQAWRLCCLKVRSLTLNKHSCAYKRYEKLLVDSETGERLEVVDDSQERIQQIAIEQFIASLPDYLRAVAEMYESGYSYQEIAAHLGVSGGTVQGYLGRIVTPPLWYSVLWGFGVSLPMYYLWDRMGKRQRLWYLFLLGVAAACVSAVVLGFQHGFAQLFSPAFLVMSILYMGSCTLITGGGLWYLKTHLLGESA